MTPKLVNDWRDLPAALRGASVALGNFDGLHHGHAAVVQAALDWGPRHDAKVGVISFEPHPRRYFQPDASPFRVMSPDQQARALGAMGVDVLYLLAFDSHMAGLSDLEFAQCVLRDGLGVRHVAVGFDVTFGKDRSGDGATLKRYGQSLGFEVTVVERLADVEGIKYASSEARKALARGEPEAAAAMLGRPFSIEGAVVKGDQRGRLLGFPTANIELADYVRPALGVYAVRVTLPDGRRVPGVANIGRRPTVGGADERLEAHLFDFDEDLYGKRLEVELVSMIRAEQKFESLDALRARITRDAAEARLRLDKPAGGV